MSNSDNFINMPPVTRSAVIFVIFLTLLFTVSCDDDLINFPQNQEGGDITDRPDVEPDQEIISPLIIVPPLLDCGTSVTVKGFIPGAIVRIYSDGSLLGQELGIDPEHQTIGINTPLATGNNITATQEFDGVESNHSEVKVVEDISAIYPTGLPKPNFPFLYLYDCGIATHVNNLPPGGQLRVYDQTSSGSPTNLIGNVNGVAEGQSLGINPPFVEDHFISAESQICSAVNPNSDIHQVQKAPSTIPKPTTDPIYEEATFVVVHGLVNGAKATISRGGSVIATFGAPSGHVRVLGVPVSAGDILDIEQKLCGVSSSITQVTVQPCSELPPPILIGPRAGDTMALLSNVVAGSRIQIYSGTEEIADGGGSNILYTRQLVNGEVLTVIQSLGGCISTNAYIVTVGRGLEDPGETGQCGENSVLQWEYGHSGDSERRTTDISGYFNSPDASVSVSMSNVPLHGVVRYPEGPGPYPLVLIVHGNHSPRDPSYLGYDYLLDLLANHCMIAVSIEEDFLNGSVFGEMDARGIVLLRHLQLWREWNRTPGHPFFTKVDMSNVGLVGHSRGGEAIVVANRYNSTLHNSADPQVGATSNNFGFGIRSLYAIAPVDGQFEDGRITLTNADYYVMHGTHDGDVYTFGGHRMYNRAFPIENTTNHFKGLLWVHGANHGQWNTGWGTCCEASVGPTPLISSSNQQQIAKTYLGGFFLAGLKGWYPYRAFLNGEASFSSIPANVPLVFQYQDPERIFLNHYEEDTDPATGSLSGVDNTISGPFENYEGYSFSDRGAPHHLWGETEGLIVGWQDSESEIQIKMNDVEIPDFNYLAFHVGQTLETPPDLNTPGNNQDFTVQLEFGTGFGPEVPISSYGDLIYPLLTDYAPKTVQQTIRIPFTQLKNLNENRPRDAQRIILRFNQKGSGNVAIDEIQFTN